MNNICELSEKSCVPCQGGIPPLPPKEIKILLNKIHNWELNRNGHLYKKYTFDNFMNAMTFANKIAHIAEKEGHHPDLMVSWGKCLVEIWTHKISGLTESDFILASKIDQIKL